MRNTIPSTLRTLLFFLAAGMFLSSCEKDEPERSSEASMTSLTLTVESTDYKVTFTGKEGKITLPYATALPATATVKAVVLSAKAKGIKVGDKIAIPVSGTVTFTVTAEDDKTTGVYTLTVEKASASTEASITALTLTAGDTDYEIMFEDRAYTLILPSGSALPTAVGVKEITLSAGATGVANDDELTVTDNMVTLTVTAEDGETKKNYTVTLSLAANAGASITTLTLTAGSTDYDITFEGTRGSVTLPYGTALPTEVGVKEITLSDGATSDAGNGTALAVTDNAVTLTVTAEDGTTKSEYTVTFSVALSSEASVTSLTLTVGDSDYDIMFEDRQDTITLPYGSTLPTAVGVKEITLSAGAAGVANDDELPVTDNAVTITVTAEDGETMQEYTVTLVVSQTAAPLFTSFTFEVADNENMALDTADRKRIEGTINEETKQITFDEQSAYVYLNRLKASFTASAGAAVQVGGSDQVSGVTEQDFTSSVSYIVRATDGTETTYTVTLTKSKLATIPDAQFRAKLKEFVPAAFTGDQLDITHADVVNANDLLDVNAQTPKLTSLKGIEFFTALERLVCAQNALASLDVSQNRRLRYLYCTTNSLTSLDVSANTFLTELNCNNNSIRSLDLSKNRSLEQLFCGNNKLNSLNVSKNTSLLTLSCSYNALESLDVSANTALESLFCRDNALDSLDVSKNTAFLRLSCAKNDLTFLDVTSMRGVSSLNIGTGTGTDNPLATLRVNTATQDREEIITMKTNRGAALTIITVNNEGTEVCTDYSPAEGGGTCN